MAEAFQITYWDDASQLSEAPARLRTGCIHGRLHAREVTVRGERGGRRPSHRRVIVWPRGVHVSVPGARAPGRFWLRSLSRAWFWFSACDTATLVGPRDEFERAVRETWTPGGGPVADYRAFPGRRLDIVQVRRRTDEKVVRQGLEAARFMVETREGS
jgi:hypothetical protein